MNNRRPFTDVFSLVLMKSSDFLSDNNSLSIVFRFKPQWRTHVRITMDRLLILIVDSQN